MSNSPHKAPGPPPCQGVEWSDHHERWLIRIEPADIDEIAKAVVSGCTIVNAVIPDLRELVEKVQAIAPSDRIAKDTPDGKRIALRCAACRIESCDFRSNSRNSGFELQLSLNFAPNLGNLGDLVYSRTCRFCRDASFERTFVYGNVSFRGVAFSRNARFNRAAFSGRASFERAKFAGELTFNGATISGEAQFDKVAFTRVSRFGSTAFIGDTSFGGATFSGEAQFHEARFSGRVRFDFARFTDRASFDETTFSDRARFNCAVFAGMVSFGAATFVCEASFCAARFSDEALFGGATFSNLALFNNSAFAGRTSFNGAAFSGKASFGGTNFSGWVRFSRATFAHEAWFAGAKFSDLTSFESATFSGRATFSRAAFASEASLYCAVFSREAVFDRTTVHGPLDLESAQVRVGALSCHGLRRGDGGALLLTESQLTQNTYFNDGRWPRDASLTHKWPARLSEHNPWRWFVEYAWIALWPIWWLLDLRPYGPFIAGSDSIAEKRLKFASEQYNILRDNFRSLPSTDEQEDICHFMMMDMRRRAIFAQLWRRIVERKHWSDDPPLLSVAFRWVWDWLIHYFCFGYMIRTRRILNTGAILILFFAVLYGWGYSAWGGDWIEYNGANPTAHGWSNAPVQNALYFSLMSFVTLGYGDFAPVGWCKLVGGIEALLGVTLLALFTVAWARKILR